MIVTPSNNENTIATKLSIRDTNLSQVHEYKYLGVHIDSKLTMGARIDIMVCTNVQKKYGILRKIRRYISLDTALLIYKVMIRHHFDYGDYMMDSGAQCKIDKLD